MVVAEALPEIRNAGDIPQKPHLTGADGALANGRPLGEIGQRLMIDGVALRSRKGIGGGASSEREAVRRRKIDIARRHQKLRIGSNRCCSTASTISGRERQPSVTPKVPSRKAGTARDLGRFRRRQAPHLAAVELHVGGQRHMPEIEVQPHADGIGGDKEIDIAILIQLDLRVAGPRAEPPHHDGGAATLAAHQLGDLQISATPKATMALRRGRRVSFFDPAKSGSTGACGSRTWPRETFCEEAGRPSRRRETSSRGCRAHAGSGL